MPRPLPRHHRVASRTPFFPLALFLAASALVAFTGPTQAQNGKQLFGSKKNREITRQDNGENKGFNPIEGPFGLKPAGNAVDKDQIKAFVDNSSTAGEGVIEESELVDIMDQFENRYGVEIQDRDVLQVSGLTKASLIQALQNAVANKSQASESNKVLYRNSNNRYVPWHQLSNPERQSLIGNIQSGTARRKDFKIVRSETMDQRYYPSGPAAGTEKLGGDNRYTYSNGNQRSSPYAGSYDSYRKGQNPWNDTERYKSRYGEKSLWQKIYQKEVTALADAGENVSIARNGVLGQEVKNHPLYLSSKNSALFRDGPDPRFIAEFLDDRPANSDRPNLPGTIDNQTRNNNKGNYSNGRPRYDKNGNELYANGARKKNDIGVELYSNGQPKLNNAGDLLHSNGRRKTSDSGDVLYANGNIKRNRDGVELYPNGRKRWNNDGLSPGEYSRQRMMNAERDAGLVGDQVFRKEEEQPAFIKEKKSSNVELYSNGRKQETSGGVKLHANGRRRFSGDGIGDNPFVPDELANLREDQRTPPKQDNRPYNDRVRVIDANTMDQQQDADISQRKASFVAELYTNGKRQYTDNRDRLSDNGKRKSNDQNAFLYKNGREENNLGNRALTTTGARVNATSGFKGRPQGKFRIYDVVDGTVVKVADGKLTFRPKGELEDITLSTKDATLARAGTGGNAAGEEPQPGDWKQLTPRLGIQAIIRSQSQFVDGEAVETGVDRELVAVLAPNPRVGLKEIPDGPRALRYVLAGRSKGLGEGALVVTTGPKNEERKLALGEDVFLEKKVEGVLTPAPILALAVGRRIDVIVEEEVTYKNGTIETRGASRALGVIER